ncbi:MAG: hypothetical protein LBH31_10700 [Burkholderiaceae bacterium]|jgi:hypothetical protein|nr:hypothetical protein [Burkholderiaceae bacterium]
MSQPLTPHLASRSLTALEAAERAPELANLARRASAARERLAIIAPLLPAPLRTSVRAGTLDEQSWCLLAPHNAAAAKLRQLAPAIAAALRVRGLPDLTLRIKVTKP